MIRARFPIVALVLVAACGTGTAVPTAPDEPENPFVDTTAAPSPSYQFGAKFEPPAGRVVHGMGQWVNGNPQYVAMLSPTNQPASELMFITLGDTPRPWDPAEMASLGFRYTGIGRLRPNDHNGIYNPLSLRTASHSTQ